MKVLLAEDDLISQQVLAVVLKNWGYDLVTVNDGKEAWQALQAPHAPKLAILDWMMPEMNGVDVCRKLRDTDEGGNPTYVIMLTAMDSKENIVEGLKAGANDYVTKPFDENELRARLEVGKRVVELQSALSARVTELQEALDHVKKLQGIIPICMHCHKIRDDQESWQRIESYLMEHADVQFSHGICSECMTEHYSDIMKD